jgi:hypothetical protein
MSWVKNSIAQLQSALIFLALELTIKAIFIMPELGWVK